MNDLARFFVRTVATTVLSLALVAWPVYAFWGSGHLIAVVAGSLVGIVNIIIAWLFNKRAMAAGESRMLRSLLSGMLLRFLVVTVAILWVAKATDLNVYTFSFALLGFYLILQVFEVNFLQKQLS